MKQWQRMAVAACCLPVAVPAQQRRSPTLPLPRSGCAEGLMAEAHPLCPVCRAGVALAQQVFLP